MQSKGLSRVFSNTTVQKHQAEEPEIKLLTSTVSPKKQESSRKTSISALLITPKPLTVWITINSGNSVRLYFGGSKITADGDFSHEIKRYLLLRRKVMTNLDSILKSRDIALPTEFHVVKAMVFPVWM